jgi:hypothetical protein
MPPTRSESAIELADVEKREQRKRSIGVGVLEVRLPDRVIRKDAVKVSAGPTTALDFDFATEGFAP